MKLTLLNLGRGSVVRAQLCPSAPPATTRSTRSRANLWLMRISLAYSILIASSIQLLARSTNGQTIDKELVIIELQNDNLVAMVKKIEAQSTLRFIYLPEQLSKYGSVTLSKGKRTIRETLELALIGTGLAYGENGKYIVLSERILDASIVKGRVTDQDGQGIAGVNIILKGTTTGTTTDVNGDYALLAEQNDVLVFSFIGYKTTEVNVASRTDVDVRLEFDLTALKEVEVKAGYYDVKVKEMPGNIVKVSSEDLQKQPSYNPLQAVQGRAAGVSIKQSSGVPGGGFSVEIRGQNSIRPDGDDPLYIIDGVPFPAQSLSKQGSGGVFSSPLNSINPSDIESIEILKDADATAIYGSLGANGVVYINTKKGKAGKTQVVLDIYTGIGQVGRKMKLLNSQQYLAMRREAYKNDGTEISGYGARDLLQWDTTRNTDWQKELIGGTSRNLNAQLSISGGNQNFQFFLSGGFFRETTVFPGDFDFKKGSLHLGLNHSSSNKKFNVDFSSNYVGTDSNLPTIDLTSTALNLPPIAPSAYTEQGALNWENSTWVNPVAYTQMDVDNQGNNMVNNINLSYMPITGLQIKLLCGYNRMELDELTKIPLGAQNPMLFPVARATLNNSKIITWNVEPQIVYSRKIGQSLQFESLVGTTLRESTTSGLAIEGTGFSNDTFIGNLSAAPKVVINNDSRSQYKYNALFGRFNFNWQGKYIVNLTGRRDGSSRFGPNRQFANFGAVGVAWIFFKEGIIQDNLSTWLSFGKLRGSLGTAGNDQIGDYQFLDTFASSPLKYQGISIFRPARLANPNYRWEITTKREVGLELGFFDDKIFTSVSYYHNQSSNQLVSYTTPATTGFSSITENLPAVIKNTGVEVQIQTVNFTNRKVKWSTSLNLTIPRNKLIKFPNLEGSSYSTSYLIGKPLTISQLYKSSGVNSQTGLYEYNDYNGDGNITTPDDRKIVINRGNSMYGGIQNSLNYAGLQLDFLFQFVRQKAGNYISYSSFEMPGTISNQPIEVMNRWQSPGDETSIQKYSRGSIANSEYVRGKSSDRAYSDASFIRLRSVSLSYQLPGSALDRIRMQAASVYVQAQNLLTITGYEGLDPENAGTSLPPLRIVTIGLRVSL